jgi:hypothetical protein
VTAGGRGKLMGGSHLPAAPGEGEGAHAGAAGGGGLGRGLRPCRVGCASRGKRKRKLGRARGLVG